MVVELLGKLAKASPSAKRALWRTWYQFISRRFNRPEWTFMNYGYAPTDPGATLIHLHPEDEKDRHYVQLYHHVASGAELAGANVLEVGSGRGGGSSYVVRYLSPQTMTGLDFSQTAVNLCEQIHKFPELSFKQGDAEALPFENQQFDVVLNVESSHCYGSMDAFLREVFRVLRPGGMFLFADFRQAEALDSLRGQISSAGFTVKQEENITPNVVRAMELTSEQKSGLVRQHVPAILRRVFKDFAGIQGTRVYNSFENGEVQYLRYVLAK
jgi:ubiquinone/menaquinone biosynthesis C-methylase UbiE